MGRNKPVAVLISDTHYTPDSLEIAKICTKSALAKAEELRVPLIDCGDLLDSKDVIRAVCANALIEIFKNAKTRVILLVGNHTLINEKSKDHALNFLRPYCDVVQSHLYDSSLNIHFVPYHSNSSELLTTLDSIPTGSTVIAHQGVQTAWMGHYVQDKSSLPIEAFKRFRTISGHYHRHQTIICSEFPTFSSLHASKFTYVGSPYTISFAESEDGPKGFQILYEDGSLEMVPLNLRKHVILDLTLDELKDHMSESNRSFSPIDKLWLKVRGPYSELEKLNKVEIGSILLGHSDFKFDPIFTDTKKQDKQVLKLTNQQIFDKLIHDSDESIEQKVFLKSLWREVLNENT